MYALGSHYSRGPGELQHHIIASFWGSSGSDLQWVNFKVCSYHKGHSPDICLKFLHAALYRIVQKCHCHCSRNEGSIILLWDDLKSLKVNTTFSGPRTQGLEYRRPKLVAQNWYHICCNNMMQLGSQLAAKSSHWHWFNAVQLQKMFCEPCQSLYLWV